MPHGPRPACGWGPQRLDRYASPPTPSLSLESQAASVAAAVALEIHHPSAAASSRGISPLAVVVGVKAKRANDRVVPPEPCLRASGRLTPDEVAHPGAERQGTRGEDSWPSPVGRGCFPRISCPLPGQMGRINLRLGSFLPFNSKTQRRGSGVPQGPRATETSTKACFHIDSRCRFLVVTPRAATGRRTTRLPYKERP